MLVPVWIWLVFVFALGCCIGSFLNVVVYRLPRDKSLVTPPSSCPSCGRHIRFYDNVPLVSWLLLGRKCRYCRTPISPRYFAIELLTGSIFLGLFILYFYTDVRKNMSPFQEGGWLIYLLHIILLATFIAASAIDLEHWIIPLSLCWFVTAAGLIGSSIGGMIIDPKDIGAYTLLPFASADSGALAAGATVGLLISLGLLTGGLIKRSYESDDAAHDQVKHEEGQTNENSSKSAGSLEEPHFNHRLEACREIVFLAPIVACACLAFWISREVGAVHAWWMDFTRDHFIHHPVVAGCLGSVWGYFIGCGVVWGIRVFGTFAFGKEAMGLGDVHLMGAAGAVIGPLPVTVAFFIAPFFGLAWAGFQMFFQKIRQIPYGPFLSLAIFVVMILHDLIQSRIGFIFYP
ncbi:MAG: prepilin peptidase [Sedimentisphaerales bacterium]|nr:prepilin peptidase [Sedimentisphaerales bacterium]